MLPYIVLLLMAVGPLVSPEWRSEWWSWALSGVSILALIGLAYGRWLEIRSQQAMIDMERNQRR